MIVETLGIEVGLEGKKKLQADWNDVVDDFQKGAKDAAKATTGAAQAAKELSGSTATVAKTMTDANRVAREAQGRFVAVAGGMRTTTAAAGGLAQGLKGAAGAAGGLKGELDGAAAAGSRVGEVFKGALGAQLIASAFNRASAAAMDFVRGSVESVLQGQRIGRSLRFAAGGAEEGAAEFKFVKAESQRLGLQLNVTAAAYSKLAAASRGTTLQGRETREIFKGVVEAATVLGLAGEDTAGALNAIQQMMSKGTVQAEELRGQLGERIPGAFQMAARAMGVTTQQLGKMLEQGQVISADFLPKFARELRKTFGSEAVAAAAEAQAGMNRFKTSLFELSASFGVGFLGGLTSAINRLRTQFEDSSFKARVQEIGKTIGDALAFAVDHMDELISTGKAFFAMFAVSKLTALVAGMRGFGLALSGVVAANPILAAVGLSLGVGVLAYEKIKDRAESLEKIKFWESEAGRIKSANIELEKQKSMLDAVKRAREDMLASRGQTEQTASPFPDVQFTPGKGPAKVVPVPQAPVKLTDEQNKTLLKLQREAAKARVDASEEGFAQERALEILDHKNRVMDLGSFHEAIIAENQRHNAALAAIDAKETAKQDTAVEKANENFLARQKREKAAEKTLLERHRAEIEEARKSENKIDEALATDEFSRQRSQVAAHFEELREAVKKYVDGRSEQEQILTQLQKRESDARKRIDREEVASRVENGAKLASNLIQGWQALYAQSKKNALLHKVLAGAEIVINTAVAVTKALAQGGMFGIPMALSIGALGAAQLYKVSQQKFAQGGVVQGPYTSGDRIPVRANAGEMILTQAQQAQLFAMANGGGGRQGGGNTYEINYRPSYQISGSMSSMALQQLIGIIDQDKAGFGRYWKNEIVRKGFA